MKGNCLPIIELRGIGNLYGSSIKVELLEIKNDMVIVKSGNFMGEFSLKTGLREIKNFPTNHLYTDYQLNLNSLKFIEYDKNILFQCKLTSVFDVADLSDKEGNSSQSTKSISKKCETESMLKFFLSLIKPSFALRLLIIANLLFL